MRQRVDRHLFRQARQPLEQTATRAAVLGQQVEVGGRIRFDRIKGGEIGDQTAAVDAGATLGVHDRVDPVGPAGGEAVRPAEGGQGGAAIGEPHAPERAAGEGALALHPGDAVAAADALLRFQTAEQAVRRTGGAIEPVSHGGLLRPGRSGRRR